MIIKAEHLHKEYGTVTVLNDVSFSLERGTRVGLVGLNGTGKSTLLKILAGELNPDSGTVVRSKEVVVGYMPQDTSLVGSESVCEYIRCVSGFEQLEHALATAPDALAEYEQRNGYTFYNRMDMILDGFGLEDVAERPLDTLSSGQKSKVFMAGVLLSDPDVLLLDEPTNNLDLPALMWLENFLVRLEATCIIVSHDRLFLDRVVRKILEINWHTRTLTVTSGRYSDYLVRKEKERTQQGTKYEAQQEEIKRLTEAARAKK